MRLAIDNFYESASQSHGVSDVAWKGIGLLATVDSSSAIGPRRTEDIVHNSGFWWSLPESVAMVRVGKEHGAPGQSTEAPLMRALDRCSTCPPKPCIYTTNPITVTSQRKAFRNGFGELRTRYQR